LIAKLQGLFFATFGSARCELGTGDRLVVAEWDRHAGATLSGRSWYQSAVGYEHGFNANAVSRWAGE
jgi:hypothetical protein